MFGYISIILQNDLMLFDLAENCSALNNCNFPDSLIKSYLSVSR